MNFYKTAAVFVTLYRSCINECGWDKLAGYKRLTEDDEEFPLPQYSTVKSSDVIPDFCNEFIMNYLPQNCNNFDRKLAIELTKHLCIWLFNRGLTKVKISMSD